MTSQTTEESAAALIYEHTRERPQRQMESIDSIDTKAVHIFAAASVVLGFGTFTAPMKWLTAAFYIVAASLTSTQAPR